ncbi:MAG: tetraacyldisaccharide 4'-kinase [Candidatus Omnitrophica bacterium]|nr:tetraacyldisaccharide 4'-kinase [Candidatus Omnitrophota bacterium]
MNEKLKIYFWTVMRGEKRGIVPTILVLFLFVLSILYGLIIKARNGLFDAGLMPTYRLPRPVISVGNIVVGGVGKTPIAIWLAETFKSMGLKPVVLMRGYMDKDHHGGKVLSDEAQVVQQMVKDVPVLIGPNRYLNAKNYLNEHPADVFILDDGFQHRQLKRDLDLVAVDATNPWGNGSLLPSGILREPVKSLKRAHVVVLTKTDLMRKNSQSVLKSVSESGPSVLVCQGVHRPAGFYDVRHPGSFSIDFVNGQVVGYFCSIADPTSFKHTLEQLGACVIKGFHFIDHHSYTEEDFKSMNMGCNVEKIKILVTTRKDAVKINLFLKFLSEDIRLLVLDICFDVTEGKDQILGRIALLFPH